MDADPPSISDLASHLAGAARELEDAPRIEHPEGNYVLVMTDQAAHQLAGLLWSVIGLLETVGR